MTYGSEATHVLMYRSVNQSQHFYAKYISDLIINNLYYYYPRCCEDRTPKRWVRFKLTF